MLLGLLTALPLATVLPQSWGWENGVLENFQVVILMSGCVTAIWAAFKQSDAATRAAWWAAALIWLILAGRELAWGAAFLPPLGFNDHGPVISSRVLWYRPAVPWVCAGLLLVGLIAMWRSHAFSRFLLRLLRDHVWPWGTMALIAACMILSAVSEGHGKLHVPMLDVSALIVAEEVFETWAYIGIWLVQRQLIRHTARWARSLYY
ncbi:hypothetical protein G7048_20500 [Diaphorobacter sp. HDW4B]|uniref:hypothetical protein n=1 Tax=Diaphorobacter sp. HDW4B TaxID=2714925 RepID=UPI00140A0AA2|nr:hypothetical protein [Diaphorobacter sp. HDW4B]QIL72527.1 hypothetical protein G7048_20500 [Diaphorobacter sp. HDW4B]